MPAPSALVAPFAPQYARTREAAMETRTRPALRCPSQPSASRNVSASPSWRLCEFELELGFLRRFCGGPRQQF
jgi:hypothetical protein